MFNRKLSFVDGNVIAQIRDYRQSYPLDICDIHYVLLRPSAALWGEKFF